MVILFFGSLETVYGPGVSRQNFWSPGYCLTTTLLRVWLIRYFIMSGSTLYSAVFVLTFQIGSGHRLCLSIVFAFQCVVCPLFVLVMYFDPHPPLPWSHIHIRSILQDSALEL